MPRAEVAEEQTVTEAAAQAPAVPGHQKQNLTNADSLKAKNNFTESFSLHFDQRLGRKSQ